MASRQTNEAVEAYRKLLVAEQRLEDAKVELTAAMLVEGFEFARYAEMTAEIDEALSTAEEVTETWMRSSARPRLRTAINGAGRDRDLAAR